MTAYGPGGANGSGDRGIPVWERDHGSREGAKGLERERSDTYRESGMDRGRLSGYDPREGVITHVERLVVWDETPTSLSGSRQR